MLNSQNPFEEIIDRLDSIEEKLSNHNTPTAAPKETSGYISRNDVCRLLSISLPTVHSWLKKGILTCYHIGGRTLFKEDEVLEAVKPVNYSVK